jgi:methylmalonyl-CoA/ethylmalonyl-CoA epimerase
MSNKIDHIAVVVKDLKKSIEQWKSYFKIEECCIEEIAERGVKLAQLKVGEGASIELVSPLGEKSTLRNFLKNKGEGIHHICFKVQDIDKSVIELKRQGVRFVSEEPIMGASGSRIIFIHPDNLNGVLIELKG